ncbi:MAG: FecR domain-containing protein [Defluviitaleaceae bacterium]|nr:FecR domain-containing protein [Defluviitaleaceae bacterium]
MKKIKYVFVIILSLTFLTACSDIGEDAVGTARTVNVFETNGENATVTRGATQTSPRAGFRLADRDIAATGSETNMFLLLNADSVMKMDALSTIEINRISVDALSLTLVEGAIVADIKRESENDIYEFRVGNVIMGVRGTSFIIEYRGNAPIIVMLEGSGEINGVLLQAGEVAVIDETAAVTVEPLDLSNINSPFIVGEINRREDLTTAYGAEIRIVAVAADAPHNETAVIIDFDLMELYLNTGLYDDISWPFDGYYELRLYTGGRLSAQTLNQSFPFIVYENIWRCLREGCVMGWMDDRQCLCVDEMEAVVRDWQ